MYYTKTTYKKEKVNGFEEGYKFNTVNSIGLTVETNVGGWENIDVSKEDKILYVLKGLGYAEMHGKTYRLEEDIVLEVPAGSEIKMNGQLKFLCITNKA